MPRWNMPRRSCHVSVGVGIVCLKLLINLFGCRIIFLMQVKGNKTKKEEQENVSEIRREG